MYNKNSEIVQGVRICTYKFVAGCDARQVSSIPEEWEPKTKGDYFNVYIKKIISLLERYYLLT